VTARIGMDIGPRAVVEEARRFGITTPIPAVPSIALGTAEVVPIDLVSAYTAFAAEGWRAEPRAILRVEDREGNIIWEPGPRRHQVMDEAHAWLMTQALRDVVRRGTAYSAVTGQGFRQPAGGKTGTSDDYADAWFVGFTRDLVTGIWIGMDRRETIFPGAQGGRLAAPVWTAIMQQEYEKRDAEDWGQPSSITWVRIDRSTGYLARPECPGEEVGLAPFEQGTEPLAWCPLHEYPQPFQIIRAVREGQ
jgi:penicillin-binding protein 1A